MDLIINAFKILKRFIILNLLISVIILLLLIKLKLR